jgi:uncharacterized protein DUF3311
MLPSMAEEGAIRREEESTGPRRAGRGWYALLLLPFLALLYPPLYAHEDPRVFGVPFFYWYQFAWLLITAAITTTVYRRTR